MGNLDERAIWKLNFLKVRPEKLSFDLHYNRKSVEAVIILPFFTFLIQNAVWEKAKAKHKTNKQTENGSIFVERFGDDSLGSLWCEQRDHSLPTVVKSSTPRLHLLRLITVRKYWENFAQWPFLLRLQEKGEERTRRVLGYML